MAPKDAKRGHFYNTKVVQLPFPEDPELAAPVTPSLEPIHRPPGVTTLQDWQETVVPEGVHKGKRFGELRMTELSYCKWIQSHRHLTSAWAKSLQQYLRAADQIEEDMMQHLGTSSVAIGSQQPVMPAKAGAKHPTTESNPELQGYMILESGRPSAKRSVEEEAKPMSVEPNPERIAQLEAQVAILQRELASARTAIWEAEK